MAIAFVVSGQITGALNGGSVNIGDTSGANHIPVHVSQFSGGTLTTPSDDKGNGAPTAGTAQTTGESYSRWFWWLNPIVGANHNITVSNLAIAASAQAYAFSGVNALDQQTGATGNVGSIQTGSLTPPSNGALFLSGVSTGNGSITTHNINSSFTGVLNTNYSAGVCEGGAAGYLIQAVAAAVNPTWSGWTNNAVTSATLMTFTAATGGGATFSQRIIGGGGIGRVLGE